MSEHVELTGLMDNPPARRLWLILKALHCLPFDQAIELARTAEAFVTGSHAQSQFDTRVNVTTTPSQDLESSEELAAKPTGTPEPVGQAAANGRSSVALSVEERDRLLTRFAEGARNAALANEFGLSLKQVQGIRMGCAREIAKRRDQLKETTAETDQTVIPTTSVEDIVRYLRQQDDIIVPQENGEFLVNARFHMPLADLVARANRMRARQGKPKFELPGGMPVPPTQNPSVNGHPLFWEQS
jgi:hypothetical protein